MEDFKEGFVTLNFVPTHVMTWGGWIEDASKSKWKEVILMFPGNPGVTLYYSEFLQHLYQKYKIPIWIVSHAGSELPKEDKHMPRFDKNLHLFGVEGQIKAKKEFIDEYVPIGCKIHLIGHSVGAYISLQLLKDDDFAERVQKSYLLFPVLENIASTPNGRFFNKIVVKFLWLVYFLAGIFHCLPYFLGMMLLSIYFRIWGTGTSPVVKTSTMQLINPKVLRAVFYLAIDEMIHIKDLDADLISKRKDKVFMYYGDHDRWAPVSHYENLVKTVPGVRAQVCERGLDHAFMLIKPSHLMAEVLEDLMDKYMQK